MKTITTEQYWDTYWAVGRPVRAARLRQAVKMSNPPTSIIDIPHDTGKIKGRLVLAHNPPNGLVASFHLDDGTFAGSATAYPNRGDPDETWSVATVYVNGPYRRKGIASALYDAIEKQTGRPLSPSGRGYGGKLSPDGHEFWRSRQRRTNQLARGIPVRMGRSDIPALYRGAWENPRDAARWGILADAMDEAGAGHTATLLREIADRAPTAEDHQMNGVHAVVDHDIRGTHGIMPTIWGSIHGLPVVMWPLSQRSQGDVPPSAWGVYLHHPDDVAKARNFTARKLWAVMPPDRGLGMLHEVTGSMDDKKGTHPSDMDIEEARRRFPLQLARGTPVRFATPQDMEGMRRLISEKYRTRDVAPMLVYADAVQEAGHDHLAHAIRQAAKWITDRRGKSLRSPWSRTTPGATAYGRHRSGLTHPIVYLFGPRQGLVSFSLGQKKLHYDTTDTDHLRALVGEMEPMHDRDAYYGSRSQMNQARRVLGMEPLPAV